MITETTGKYPHEIHAMVLRAVQLEWIFLQHMAKYTGKVFVGVEKVLQETFLLRLFFGKLKILPPIVGTLSALRVKKSSLVLYNPVT